MKKMVAFLLAVGLAGGAFYLSQSRRAKPPEVPENVIWRMLEHSRAGSVEGYLDCFTGPMRAQLDTTARGMTFSRFSDYLRESVEKVKGVAVYDVQRSGEQEASLVVEYVYQDQNERQRMILKKEKDVWRIESADSSRRIQPLIPYGQPVTEVQ